jgi:diguanylate cyclase (GGDEF)-like protein/PAS domain S-box-containing protein
MSDDARPAAWLDLLPDGVVIIDALGVVIDANATVCRLLGRDRDDIVGINGFDLLHPDDVARAVQAVADEFVDTEAVLPTDVRLLAADGGWLPVEITGIAVERAEGNLLALCIRDMRRRAKLEEQLRRERSFLQSVLSEVEVGILACDAEGRVSVYSHAVRGVLPTAGAVHLDEWLARFRLFEADGVTPLPASQAPLSRAFRGEVVRDVEFSVLGDDGELHFRRANGEPLFDGTGAKIGAVVAVHDITEQRQAERALRRQALHDPLTGLPNRSLLIHRLGDALERNQIHPAGVALFFVDLDRFKLVNDGLGHTAGDELLMAVGVRLEEAVRPGDTVARLGGDEFVVLCEPIAGPDETAAIAERLGEAVGRPVRIGDHEVRVTASIGVTVASSSDVLPEAMLRDSDLAMYRAKERGRDGWELFDDRLRERVLARIATEHMLLHALDNGQLRLLFQPVIDAATGALAGAEALVRLELVDGTLIEPIDFIGVAEESGLVTRVDQWVLAETCRQAAAWASVRPGSPLIIGWNASSRTIGRGDFVAFVRENLNRFGVAPAQLCLELTETTLIAATAATRHALTRLREEGLLIGLDDFGTGYSSLTNLRDFAVSFVKIDSSFTSGIPHDHESTAIARAIIDLAHALGLTVVAEGVNTEAQRVWLAAAGCDHLQGYLFSPPVPADTITAWLLRQAAPLAEAGDIA